MKKIKKVVFTNQNEHSIPDAHIEEWYQHILSIVDNDIVYISNYLQLLRLRIAIIKKDIFPFIFECNNILYTFDETAKFNNNLGNTHPLNIYEEFLYELL